MGWQKLVLGKIAGQLTGLVWMVCAVSMTGVHRAAASVLGSNLIFWFLGGAGARHDASGTHRPLPRSGVKILASVDALICALALAASALPIGSGRHDLLAKYFSIGVIIGVLENAQKMGIRVLGLTTPDVQEQPELPTAPEALDFDE